MGYRDPADDRVIVMGDIAGVQDVDRYSLKIAQGETFAVDIDAAEFQRPLDAVVEIFDSAGNLVARGDDAVDRESGIDSHDPYLVHTFAADGVYTIQVSSAQQTAGSYRLKVSDALGFDRVGPRVLGVSPTATGQLTLLFDDLLDPATLTTQTFSCKGPAASSLEPWLSIRSKARWSGRLRRR
jgi:hypothetical protein